MRSLKSLAIILTLFVTGSGFADAAHDALRAAESVAGKHMVLDITYTVYSCSCRGSWTCSGDSSVRGNVTSTTGQQFRSLSENVSQASCRADLMTQINGSCNGFGNPVLTPTFNCTSEETSTPPSPVPPTGSYIAPDGTVWGPVARTVNGGIRNMTQYQAVEYCESQGLSLPTRAQFDTLRSQLGYPNNYNPAPVPDLNGNYFWSSSVVPAYSNFAYYFLGRNGFIYDYYRGDSDGFAVRCVGVRGKPI